MIQRSLDLGIEMQLVRKCDTRAVSYCILGGIKEVVGVLSRTRAAMRKSWCRRSSISDCAESRVRNCSK